MSAICLNQPSAFRGVAAGFRGPDVTTNDFLVLGMFLMLLCYIREKPTTLRFTIGETTVLVLERINMKENNSEH